MAGPSKTGYTIVFARSARRDLQRVDHRQALRILERVEGLSMEPRPVGCCKLQGEQNLWRIRVGDYRVVYSISDHEGMVDVAYVRHRREVYR